MPGCPGHDKVSGHVDPSDQIVDVPFETVDHGGGDQGLSQLQLRPLGRIGGHLGHQHVEVPLQSGEQTVQFRTRIELCPGQAHHRLGLIHQTVDLDAGGGLADPPTKQEAGSAVITGLRIDLHHALITRRC